MCGIVGHVGPQNSIEPVLEGLNRLEYRGYDSAGISFIDQDGELNLFKKEGKLENLKAMIDEKRPFSRIAIGHTRWATHGKVNDTNAHPHSNDFFSMVHNGIIENAFDIRESLEKEGFRFQSDTDSEVFLHLVTKYYRQENDIRKALGRAFKLIQGNSAFVLMAKGDSTIYSIKRGAPLVCGENLLNGEAFVSSDPYALVGLAERIYFPEDEVICVSSMTIDVQENRHTSFFETDLSPSSRFTETEQSGGAHIATKGEFEHFMLKEIFEQPDLIANHSSLYLKGDSHRLLSALERKSYNKVYIIGCGTAWHAGLLIANAMETIWRTPAQAVLASEFRYGNPILSDKDLCLFISQSGETADTLACAELAKGKKANCFSIVNVENSTLYRLCDTNLLIHAGPEIGVASTKAFTLQFLTGYYLTLQLAGKLNPSQLQKEIGFLGDQLRVVLEKGPVIEKIAREFYQHKGFIFTGRSVQFPIALEGALKLKEIAYVHAEGYASGELKHGPIALIDEEMVNIALVTPHLYEKTLSNVEEVKARGGKVFSVGPSENKYLEKISDAYLGLEFSDNAYVNALISNVVLQLFSYHVAKLKGTDIDKPRNLAKSVTVE